MKSMTPKKIQRLRRYHSWGACICLRCARGKLDEGRSAPQPESSHSPIPNVGAGFAPGSRLLSTLEATYTSYSLREAASPAHTSAREAQSAPTAAAASRKRQRAVPQDAPLAITGGSHGSRVMTPGKDCGLYSRDDAAAPGQAARQHHQHWPQLAGLGSRRGHNGGGGGSGTDAQLAAASGNDSTGCSHGETIEGSFPARRSSTRNGATAKPAAIPASTESQCPFCQAALTEADREDHIAAELSAMEDGRWHDFRPGHQLEAGADAPRWAPDSAPVALIHPPR